MPTSVFFVLTVLVGAYVVLAGTASLGFVLARRESPPPDPHAWPTVSVVVPRGMDPAGETLSMIRACDYPAERLEILVLADAPTEHSSHGDDDGVMVRRISYPNAPAAPLQQGIAAAKGDVVLTLPAGGTVSSGWIRSMVRRCTPETPFVVGPTIVEHEDLFLPRLEALSHLGRLACTAGLSYVGLPSHVESSNRAVYVDALPATGTNTPPTERPLRNISPVFTPHAEAVVARPPVNSFKALLRRRAQGLRPAFQSPSWFVRGQGTGLWLLHSLLLACSVVAVGVPAWRQPTLLAVVALMGANVVLSLPAAKPYGQRGLLRSIVATVLMQVVALPLAGLWALVDQFREPTPEPHSET